MTKTAWVWKDPWGSEMGPQFDVAAIGLEAIGWNVKRFKDRCPHLSEGDILYGCADHVRDLGIVQVPDYPESLLPVTAPKERMRFSQARELELPFFIKPVSHKEFTGFVATEPSMLSAVEGDPEVWVGPVQDMGAEWRVYVLRGEVQKICHYKGDPTLLPSIRFIESCVRGYVEAPAAYALDVSCGSLQDAPFVVEVNDMFCLGNYGVEAEAFAEMLVARWGEVYEEV